MAAVMKTATAIGSVASFWSPKPAAIKSLKVYFEPKQAGEGDPSPDNVRPVEGWTGVETWKTGKNLFDENSAIFGYWTSANGTANPSKSGVRSNYIPTEGGSTYTVMYHGTPPYSYSFVELDENYNFVTRTHKEIYGTSDSFYKPLSVTMQDKTKYFYIQTYRLSEQMTPEYLSSIKIQLEYGNSASDYEPYIDNKTTTSWESQIGTVYGGYVDLISGELTVTKSKYTFTGSEADGITFYGQITDSSGVDRNIFRTKILDRYFVNGSTRFSSSNIALPHLTENRQRKPEIMIYIGTPTNQVQFYSKTSLCEPTVESFNNFLSEHNIDLVGLLANPVTHQLTPQQLSAFIGRNNFFSNATKVEVEYEYADSPELEVIKKRIALNEPHLATAEGTVGHFYTDMAAPVKSLKVSFSPRQPGTGDASPTNVKPILGFDSINVKRCGINLLQCDTFNNMNSHGIKYEGTRNSEGEIESIHVYGTSDQNNCFSNLNTTINKIKLVPGSFGFYGYADDGVNIYPITNRYGFPDRNGMSIGSGESNWHIIDIPEYKLDNSNHAWVRIQSIADATGHVGESIDTTVYPMMCVEEDVGCDFEPYHGDTYTVSFSELGTIYGGYVDLIKGELTVTWNKTSIKDTSVVKLEDSLTAAQNFQIFPPRQATIGFPTTTCPLICDTFMTLPQSGSSISTRTNIVVWQSAVDGTFRVKTQEYCGLTANEFKEQFGDVQFAYQLRSPITYQLTPQQIKTFRGTNNIYSFDGTVDVKYWLHSDQKVTRKTVVWNNKCNGYISDADWKDRNTDETHTTFEDGVATIDFYNSPGSFHTMVQKVSPPVSTNSIYYMSYWFKPNKAMDGTGIVGAEFAGGAQIYNYLIAEPGVWYHISVMAKGRRDTTGAAYIPFVSSGSVSGLIAQVKSPVYIDLTLMFGAGNEPATPEEFEHLCAINGVDLTKPQAYDEGTERSWIIN